MKEALEKTEDSIRNWIEPTGPTRDTISAEELFWLRVDAGELYLEEMQVPPDVKGQLKKSPAFWAWFRSIWHFNDLYLLKHYRAKYELIPIDWYYLWQIQRMQGYKPNRVIMEMALKAEVGEEV